MTDTHTACVVFLERGARRTACRARHLAALAASASVPRSERGPGRC